MAMDKQRSSPVYPLKNSHGEFLTGESMARYTSWRVGGPVDNFYIPTDKDDLSVFLAQLPADEPLMFLGLGSNLLVRDGGIRGTVVGLKSVLGEMHVQGESRDAVDIYAEAGVPCALLARFGAKLGLTGGEFFAGIPGTVGGALAMNAGAFGGETWKQVVNVETITRNGKLVIHNPSEYQIGYRSVIGPVNEWFVSAVFRFVRDPDAKGEVRIKELLNKRSSTQPIGVYSCGSVFRNPPGDYAARLIEATGLKAYRIGGATVSEKHANFIINEGQASAADIEALIEHVRRSVNKATGILLHPEVLIVGERL
jgi:UDP-N-acetylmuramate dehydrogenase